MEREYIKYVHIMPMPLERHNSSIIEMIQDNQDKFNIEEHLFIVSNESLFERYKENGNIIYDSEIFNNYKKIYSYIKDCKYIFLHYNALKVSYLIKFPKEILKKIIWIVWGADLYQINKQKQSLKAKLREAIRKYYTGKYYAIGIGFKYDLLEVAKKYKNINIFPLPYGYEKNKKQQIDDAIEKSQTVKKNNQCKIMIGHSSQKYLNHIKILDILKKYKDENILISLILSYGDNDSNYATQVEKYAIQEFGEDKVEIIKNYMPKEKYIQYLNSVDVFILDTIRQTALFNIWRLLYMKKKIFLADKGILKLAMNFESIETYSIKDIANMNFEEFIKPIKQENISDHIKNYIDEKWNVQMWHNTLKELE